MKKIMIIFLLLISIASYAKNAEQCMKDLGNAANDLRETSIGDDSERMYEIAIRNNDGSYEIVETLIMIYPTLASYSMGISISLSIKKYMRNTDINKEEIENINQMMAVHATSYVRFLKNAIEIYGTKIKNIKNPQLFKLSQNIKFKLENLVFKYRECG